MHSAGCDVAVISVFAFAAKRHLYANRIGGARHGAATTERFAVRAVALAPHMCIAAQGHFIPGAASKNAVLISQLVSRAGTVYEPANAGQRAVAVVRNTRRGGIQRITILAGHALGGPFLWACTTVGSSAMLLARALNIATALGVPRQAARRLRQPPQLAAILPRQALPGPQEKAMVTLGAFRLAITRTGGPLGADTILTRAPFVAPTLRVGEFSPLHDLNFAVTVAVGPRRAHVIVEEKTMCTGHTL